MIENVIKCLQSTFYAIEGNLLIINNAVILIYILLSDMEISLFASFDDQFI